MERVKSCVAFGTFEFIHKGHLEVARRTVELAKEKNLQSVIVSCPNDGDVYTTEKEKEYLLKQTGIDSFITYAESTKLEEFFVYLKEELGAQLIVVGENHQHLAPIQTIAESMNISIELTKVVCIDEKPITYDWLVQTFEANDFEMLAELCNHPYVLIGDVIHGKKLGRTVGMPTTNLHIYKKKKRPNCGVYATKVILEDEVYKAATNIGTRPTVDDFDYVTIESFILDFDKQIYGEICVLEVYKYLRGIQKFADLQQVQNQVKKDIEEINHLFS